LHQVAEADLFAVLYRQARQYIWHREAGRKQGLMKTATALRIGGALLIVLTSFFLTLVVLDYWVPAQPPTETADPPQKPD
jgi:hypothetical protein